MSERAGRRSKEPSAESFSRRRAAMMRVPGREFDAAAVHRAILSGLVTSIGRKEEKGEYVAPRGVRFAIFPGSALHRSEAPWIMAAELVETTRLYARTCAKIRGDWVERVAPHMVRREHFEPHWVRSTGQVAAYERVSLHGLVLVPRRRVSYGPIDPIAARDIFIQALVDEQVRTDGAFLDHNRELLERLEAEETKQRRRGAFVEPTARFEFYDARVPADVHSTPSFESWRRRAERGQPRLLFMAEADLRRPDPAAADADGSTDAGAFPDAIEVGGLRLPLDYRHDPGEADDGVTLTVPVAALPQVDPDRLEWLVPGLLREKVVALIRTLPKRLRIRFVPASEFADGAAEALPFGEGSLCDRLAKHLHRLNATPLAPSDFRVDLLPTHLRMNVRVVAADGAMIASGRDLSALQRDLADAARASLLPGAAVAAIAVEHDGNGSATLPQPVQLRDGMLDFPPEGLPETATVDQGGMRLTAFPAIVDDGASVSLRLMPTAASARRATRFGLRRLFLIAAEAEIRPMLAYLPGPDGTPGIDRIALLHAPLGARAALEEAMCLRIAEVAFLPDGTRPRAGGAPPSTAAQFAEALAAGRPRLWQAGLEVTTLVERTLAVRHEIARVLDAPLPSTWESTAADVRAQLSELLAPDFIAQTPWHWFVHVPRYLAAILQRFESLRGGGHARDAEATATVRRLWTRWEQHRRDLAHRDRDDAAMERYRWMVEEFRVSLFAQRLRTAMPVSAERLDRAWTDALDGR